MKKNINYQEKIEKEKEWHVINSSKNKGKKRLITRILRSKLFFSPERNNYNYSQPKKQMVKVLKKNLKKYPVDKLLIAPCGHGDDYPFLTDIAKSFHGIDLSELAINDCPAEIKTKIGDMMHTGYSEESFDTIVSPLIFHHLLKIGFNPFLKEFSRILKKGGNLVILEPSVYYPLNLITRPAKHIFGNPLNEVEDEAPFRPGLMLSSLEKAGFKNIKVQAASFSHCTFYIPLAKIINFLTYPLLKVPLIKKAAWMLVYYAEKP